MDTITTQISLADSAAESMSNQLVRARELAIIAANGTMTATDRQNISTELAQIIEQVLALANTRDSSGNYIFSGAQVGAPDRKSTRLNSSHYCATRMQSSA